MQLVDSYGDIVPAFMHFRSTDGVSGAPTCPSPRPTTPPTPQIGPAEAEKTALRRDDGHVADENPRPRATDRFASVEVRSARLEVCSVSGDFLHNYAFDRPN